MTRFLLCASWFLVGFALAERGRTGLRLLGALCLATYLTFTL